jgi:2',3'-cyclic-nucleotide 2'-phosphodiesterase (5'-nucleotidase family)
MDHFGALVTSEKEKSKASGVLSAGPLFFMDMELAADRRAQEIAKADTIAASMKSLGLLGFAPGRNDWAGGPDTLKKLTDEAAAPLVSANLEAKLPAPVKWTKKKVGAIELGIIGVAAPDKAKLPLEGVTSSPAADAVKAGVAALRKACRRSSCSRRSDEARRSASRT